MLKRGPLPSISASDIAREAGVSTATLYRWWDTKEALLLDAFLHRTANEIVLAAQGSPLERLKDYVLQMARLLMGENGIVVARVLAAILDNPVLRNEFQQRFFSPRSQETRAVVKEAIRKGQLPAGTDVNDFLDSVIGPMLGRLFVRYERINEQFAISVFDRVVAGTKASSPRRR
jgi:AcrR family transcriptional regulator